jgi:N-acetylglucosaminyl-diphospho-decaprenol L-rhamnosyltransferase
MSATIEGAAVSSETESNRDPTPRLDVAIVNWNSGDLVRECIAALAESSIAAGLRVTVVDNASADGSADGLERPGLAVEVLRNSRNRGFGAACNQAARQGDAPFLLFLNPDTRVQPRTLEAALAVLAAPEHASTGILGVRLVDDAGRTQRTCARAPTPAGLLLRSAGLDRVMPGLVRPHFMTEWDHEDTRPVDQVMGAFLLIRRPLFERIGGFDERFFVYYEDVDLCDRARGAGARVLHFAGAAAWHRGGGTTDQVRDRRLFYLLRSEALYAGKRFGRAAALAVLAAAFAVNVPVRAAHALLRRRPHDAGQALGGGRLLLRDLPGLLLKLARKEGATR